MSKVLYDEIMFDSEWEKDYYIYLKDDIKALKIKYHPKPIFDLVARKQYTPDFIYQTNDTISVVEVKGNYNPFANHFQDDMIHKEMKAKSLEWLVNYCYENDFHMINPDITTYKYEKVKKLKQGWVDYDFKNPNTIANKRKEKINELSSELKELRQFKKDTIRYFSLHNKSKLTANQKEFIAKYLNQFYKDSE